MQFVAFLHDLNHGIGGQFGINGAHRLMLVGVKFFSLGIDYLDVEFVESIDHLFLG